MKNKAFLPILEQLLMIFIFFVACAICLRVFSLANQMSKDRDSLDRAVVAAQNAAELIKSNGGDFAACAQALSGTSDGDTLTVFYDAKGSPVDNESKASLKLVITKTDPPNSLTERARILVTKNKKTIYTLDIIWQTEGSK